MLAAAGMSACAQGEEEAPSKDLDPVIQRALNDPIMVDPDLVSQNMANSAITFEIGQPLPPENSSPSAINAAREEAIAQLGGSGGLAPLPEGEVTDGLAAHEAINTIGRLRRLSPPQDCVDAARFSAIWAARLPQALMIYPRGSTKEAIGVDAPQCKLRAVIYLSPVPATDVLAFHHAKVLDSGFRSTLSVGSGWHVLAGSKAKARYEITARSLPSGMTEIGIVSLETF